MDESNSLISNISLGIDCLLQLLKVIYNFNYSLHVSREWSINQMVNQSTFWTLLTVVVCIRVPKRSSNCTKANLARSNWVSDAQLCRVIDWILRLRMNELSHWEQIPRVVAQLLTRYVSEWIPTAGVKLSSISHRVLLFFPHSLSSVIVKTCSRFVSTWKRIDEIFMHLVIA